MMKLLLQIVLKIRRCYWWLVRPTTKGARAILVNPAGDIILVRHKYGEGWFLPGGKSKRNESEEETIRRELKEELGVVDIFQVVMLGEYQNTYEYKKDTVTVFVVTSFTLSPKKHFEIEMWNFFNPRMLPDKTSPGTTRRIQEWLKQKPVSQHW
ncbi:MAG: NUDIX domain-containing protein [Patescibacteria group bacterium]